jgi:hypothetical protein
VGCDDIHPLSIVGRGSCRHAPPPGMGTVAG